MSLFVQERKGEMNADVFSLSASVCASVCKEGKKKVINRRGQAKVRGEGGLTAREGEKGKGESIHV